MSVKGKQGEGQTPKKTVQWYFYLPLFLVLLLGLFCFHLLITQTRLKGQITQLRKYMLALREVGHESSHQGSSAVQIKVMRHDLNIALSKIKTLQQSLNQAITQINQLAQNGYTSQPSNETLTAKSKQVASQLLGKVDEGLSTVKSKLSSYYDVLDKDYKITEKKEQLGAKIVENGKLLNEKLATGGAYLKEKAIEGGSEIKKVAIQKGSEIFNKAKEGGDFLKEKAEKGTQYLKQKIAQNSEKLKKFWGSLF